jgi:hypothetical protein
VNAGGATAVESVVEFPVLRSVLVFGAANPINSKFKTKPVATVATKLDAEETYFALETSAVLPCGSETTPKT